MRHFQDMIWAYGSVKTGLLLLFLHNPNQEVFIALGVRALSNSLDP